MKNLIIFNILFLISFQLFSQAVGYQGKKFMIEFGYSPSNNLTSKSLGFLLADDYYNSYDAHGYYTEYPLDEKDPLVFNHNFKLSMEYVIFKRGSLFVSANPVNITSNFYYRDNLAYDSFEPIALVAGKSKGYMLNAGFKAFLSATPAPLGPYAGVILSYYSFTTELTESEFSNEPIPEEIIGYTTDKYGTTGGFVILGSKSIFWDKMTFDFMLQAGIYASTFADVYEYNFPDSQYSFEFDPNDYTLRNTTIFFTVSPTLSIGYLLF